MTQIAQQGFILICAAAFAVFGLRPAFGDVVARGSATFDVNTNTNLIDGSLTLNNETRSVFGTSVNLGTAGTLTFSGRIFPSDSPELVPTTFRVKVVGSPCSLCDSDCNVCNPTCPLCFVELGDVLCSAAGCQSGSSFLGTITNLTGTIITDAVPPLPSGLAITNDWSTTLTVVEEGVSHFTTTSFAINAFQPVDTETGPNRKVETSTKFLDSKTDTETLVAVDVTYASVTGTGKTTVIAQSAGSLPPNPVGTPSPSFGSDVGQCSKTKKLACEADGDCPTGETCAGYHGFFFDVSTTAVVTPPIMVCSHYQDKETKPKGGNGIVDGTGKPGLPEKSLRLLHEVNGRFVDVTLPGYPDTVNNVICGQVDSLSHFLQAVGKDMPGGGDPTTDCYSEWSLCPSGYTGGGNVKVPRKRRGAQQPITEATMTCLAHNAKCHITLSGASACNFCVRVCAHVSDSRLPSCSLTGIAIKEYLLTEPLPGSGNDGNNAGRIVDLLGQLVPGAMVDSFRTKVTFPSPVTSYTCSNPINITLPVNPGFKKKVVLTASPSSGVSDLDTLSLVCNP